MRLEIKKTFKNSDYSLSDPIIFFGSMIHTKRPDTLIEKTYANKPYLTRTP